MIKVGVTRDTASGQAENKNWAKSSEGPCIVCQDAAKRAANMVQTTSRILSENLVAMDVDVPSSLTEEMQTVEVEPLIDRVSKLLDMTTKSVTKVCTQASPLSTTSISSIHFRLSHTPMSQHART